jgi:peptide/nickel transport system permease protein
MFESVVNKDMPMLQAAFVAIVALAVAISTLADIAYAMLDPRVRYDPSGR